MWLLKLVFILHVFMGCNVVFRKKYETILIKDTSHQIKKLTGSNVKLFNFL